MQPIENGPPRRVFRVGGVTVDEGRDRHILVDGDWHAIEPILLKLFLALLRQPKLVFEKKPLLKAVWTERKLVASENSLRNAISRLKGALGTRGSEIIKNVEDEGYRIGLPVETWVTREALHLVLGFVEGEKVPFRPQWRFDRPLDAEGRVWRALHMSTGEAWVFSFADSVETADILRRQLAASQLLEKNLADQGDRAKVVDSNFDEVPYFIARPFMGIDLAAYATAGGLRNLDLSERIDLMVGIARAVARAHAAGVLHGAISPRRVLLVQQENNRLRPCLFGFLGSQSHDIDLPSLLPAVLLQSRAPYLAPEVEQGESPIAASDVYALGVLLFQILKGDLQARFNANGFADIPDALLQEDIAEAAADDPSRRLESAAALVKRLEALPERREKAALERALALQVTRARRNAIVAGVSLFFLGLLALVAFDFQRERVAAIAQRARAEQITSVTEETVSGLVNDIARSLGDTAGVRLDVLQELLSRADATLVRMMHLAPSDLRLSRLQATALTEFSKIYLQKTDLPKALEAGERAAEIQRHLLDSSPNDAGMTADLAKSEGSIGDIKMQSRDFQGALAAYQMMSHLYSQLANSNAADTYLRRQMVRAEIGVGDVQNEQGDKKQALATYRLADAQIHDFYAQHKSEQAWLLDLGDCQKRIGDVLEKSNDPRGALNAYQTNLSVRLKLVATDGLNNAWRHDLSVAESDVGDEEVLLHDLSGALLSYQTALALDLELTRLDPSNAVWKRSVAVAYSDLGDVQTELHDEGHAIEYYKSAKLILDPLVAASADDTNLLLDLASADMNIGDGLIISHDLVQARPYASQALQLAKRLVAEHPGDPALAHALSVSQDVAKRAGLTP